MTEDSTKKRPMNLYEIIDLDISQNFFPKRKKEELSVTKASSGDSNSSNNSNASTASQSTAASKTSSSSSNKPEIQLKKYFEPNYKSNHVNKREPTEEEVLAAFKFYD